MKKESVVTRFAPSPTGYLHLGHAYSALLAFRYARDHGGEFLLRFEDIDHTRVRPEYYEQIISDLSFLGISWDGVPVKQSERLPIYRSYLERLIDQNVLYPCFCTRKELNEHQIQEAPHEGEHQIYPGFCKSLKNERLGLRISDGHPFCWRLDSSLLNTRYPELQWNESGESVTADIQKLGDVVIARKDINLSYHLCVVIDDFLQKVSTVVRGSDLFDSTNVHIGLQNVLGFNTPNYLHHKLIKDENGQRLAKRNKARSIKELREHGISKEGVFKLLDLDNCHF